MAKRWIYDRVSLMRRPAGENLAGRAGKKRCSVIADRPMQRQACLRARGCGRGGGYINRIPVHSPPCRPEPPRLLAPLPGHAFDMMGKDGEARLLLFVASFRNLHRALNGP